MSMTTDDSTANRPEPEVARGASTLGRSAVQRLLALPVVGRVLGRGRAALDLCARYAVVLVGCAWFVAALAVTLWVWGLEPLAFPAGDEAVNRLAASLIQRTGAPIAKLPFSDPEDLVHMRLWLSVGERALPLLRQAEMTLDC